MKLSEENPSGPVLITGYGDGGFRLGETRHQGHLLVYGSSVHTWKVSGPKTITRASLAPLLKAEKQPEFILLGLGTEIADPILLSRKFTQDFGLVVEVMTTGAAARTYNVLVMEGRFVAAGLLAL